MKMTTFLHARTATSALTAMSTEHQLPGMSIQNHNRTMHVRGEYGGVHIKNGTSITSQNWSGIYRPRAPKGVNPWPASK